LSKLYGEVSFLLKKVSRRQGLKRMSWSVVILWLVFKGNHES